MPHIEYANANTLPELTLEDCPNETTLTVCQGQIITSLAVAVGAINRSSLG